MIETAPVINVEVVTELTSTSATPVDPPTAATLKDKMEAKTGKTFTVDVSDPEVVSPTTAAASESGASKMSFTGVALALLVAAFFSN